MLMKDYFVDKEYFFFCVSDIVTSKFEHVNAKKYNYVYCYYDYP